MQLHDKPQHTASRLLLTGAPMLPTMYVHTCVRVAIRRQRISLYAHISGLALDYNTLDQPVTAANIADTEDGAIRSVTIDHSAPAYETANMLWDSMDTPQL